MHNCTSTMFALVSVKNVKNYALSNTLPLIQDLTQLKQAQPSHMWRTTLSKFLSSKLHWLHIYYIVWYTDRNITGHSNFVCVAYFLYFNKWSRRSLWKHFWGRSKPKVGNRCTRVTRPTRQAKSNFRLSIMHLWNIAPRTSWACGSRCRKPTSL